MRRLDKEFREAINTSASGAVCVAANLALKYPVYGAVYDAVGGQIWGTIGSAVEEEAG